jgi:hypothetical protein
MKQIMTSKNEKKIRVHETILTIEGTQFRPWNVSRIYDEHKYSAWKNSRLQRGTKIYHPRNKP